MRRLVAVAVAVLLTACGVPQDDGPRALDPSAAPFGVFQREAVPPPGPVLVEVWFVRDDRLVPVTRPVELPGSPQQVVATLLGGVSEPERAAGLASAVPAAVTLSGVQVRDRIAVVSLEGLNEQVQVLAFAQIVATLDGRPEVDGVRFRSRDRDVQVPRGDGSLTDAPVNRDSYAELLGLPPQPAAVPPPPVTPSPEAAPSG